MPAVLKASEHSRQVLIADVLAQELAPARSLSRHGVVWWSTDHANSGSKVPGARIARGIGAGIPDVFLMWRGRSHFIELKTPDGKVSPSQASVIMSVAAAGGMVSVATDAVEVLALLDWWGIPRARKVHL